MAGLRYALGRAALSDKPAIVDFFNGHWGSRHNLLNLDGYFDHYFADGDRLNFALARDDSGAIVGAAGFKPASGDSPRDLWLILLLALKTATGAGMALVNYIKNECDCRVLSCNNIRPETCAMYEFLGYATGRQLHGYRLADLPRYRVATVAQKVIPPAGGGAELRSLGSPEALRGFYDSLPAFPHRPHKDAGYFCRRFYGFPHYTYDVCAVWRGGEPAGLAVLRRQETERGAVLRLVDFWGADATFAQMGQALDGKLDAAGAEYLDIYCAGLPPAVVEAAGFVIRGEGDPNVIPNYLAPIKDENTDYYYFTSDPEQFRLFRADGDQDRKTISE